MIPGPWQQLPPVPEATCRGCEAGLWRRGDRWADENGIEVCVKKPLAMLGAGNYIFHEPMPAGLRGAPDAADPYTGA